MPAAVCLFSTEGPLMCAFLPYRGTNREGQQRVDITSSPCGRRTTGILCRVSDAGLCARVDAVTDAVAGVRKPPREETAGRKGRWRGEARTYGDFGRRAAPSRARFRGGRERRRRSELADRRWMTDCPRGAARDWPHRLALARQDFGRRNS